MTAPAPGPPDRRAALTSAAIVGVVVILVGFASGLGITVRPAGAGEPTMAMPGPATSAPVSAPAATSPVAAAPAAGPAATPAGPAASGSPAPTASVTVTVPAPTISGSPSPSPSPTGGTDCSGLLGSILNSLTTPIIGPVLPLGSCAAGS